MTQDQTHTDGSRIDSTTRRGALAALGGAGLLAALGGSVQADVGGGPESDELAHLLSRFYEGPEDELPESGVEGRRFLVTDSGGEYSQWTVLRDNGTSWNAMDLGLGLVHAEDLNLDWITRYRAPTLFGPIQSLDAWRTSETGGGGVVTTRGGAEITNGANDGGGGYFEFMQPGDPAPIANVSWDANRWIQTRPNFDGETANRTDYLTTGRVHDGRRGFGFKLDADTLEGVVHDGSSETTTTLVNSPATAPELRAEFTAAEKVEFYVDGGKEGEITNGLPSGATRAFYLAAFEHIASTADVRRLQIGDVRVVQSEVA